MSKRRSERQKVYICYSRRDRVWFKRLQAHLKPLEREGRIEVWDDTKILTGSNWRKEIERAIESTSVAVLLISDNFLSSKLITRYELPLLLRSAEKEGTQIIPIIVGPSAFERTPSLSRFRSVNDPSKPLVNLSRTSQDAVLSRAAHYIADAFSDFSEDSVIDLSEDTPIQKSVAIQESESVAKGSTEYDQSIILIRLIHILRGGLFIIVSLIFGASVTAAFMWWIPHIGSHILGPNDPNNIQMAQINTTLQGSIDQIRGPGEQISGTLSLRIPKTAKVSETIPISAQFKPDSEYIYTLSTALKLESPSFKITETKKSQSISPGQEFNWNWLILPEAVGRHAISIRFDPDIQYNLDENRRPEEFQINSNSILAFITVLNDLGLTATQDIILKGLGAALGVIATLLGLPFLKRIFEPEDQNKSKPVKSKTKKKRRR